MLIVWRVELLRVVTVDDRCPPAWRPRDIQTSGSLSSMNYPNNYSNNSDCHWRLVAMDGVSYSMYALLMFSDKLNCQVSLIRITISSIISHRVATR